MYTPQSATQELRKIRPLLRSLKRKFKIYQQLIRDYDPKKEKTPNYRLEKLELEMIEIIQALEQKGIYVRRIDKLVVDFLAIRIGQPVYLCWRERERTVRHFHGTAEGYQGRRLISPFDEWQMFLVRN